MTTLPQSRYRWVILGIGLTTQFLAYGVWYSFPVFFVAMLDELGWARGPAAGAFSLMVLMSALVGPVVGGLTERFGPRLIIPAGAALLAASMAGCASVTELWQLYLWYGIVAGVGIGLAGWVSNVTAVSHWFPRSVASATGLTSAGVGLSILLLAPAMQATIASVGWRQAFLVMAALTLCLAPANLLLHRALPTIPSEDSEGAGARAATSRARREAGVSSLIVDRAWAGRVWTLVLATHTSRFWLLFVGFFSVSFAAQLVVVHEVAFLVDHGYTAAVAATAAGLVGLGSIPAKVLNGAISDRIGREVTLTLDVALLLTGLSFLYLAGVGPIPTLVFLFPLFIGAGHSCIAVIAPAMAADVFRGPSFGTIFGAVSCGSGCGGAIGAWAAGAIFDRTGSYEVAFAAAAAACLISVTCGWLAAPRKVRRVPKEWHHHAPVLSLADGTRS